MKPRADSERCPCGKLRGNPDAKHSEWCPEKLKKNKEKK